VRPGDIVRKLLTSLCVAVLSCASLGCTTDLTGVWKIQFKRDSWDYFDSATCTFSGPHDHLTVECGHDTQFVSAKLDGRRFAWQFTSGFNQSILATFSGDLEDGSKTIKGTWEFVDSSNNTSGGGTFQAAK
jgi:hypothetical protein